MQTHIHITSLFQETAIISSCCRILDYLYLQKITSSAVDRSLYIENLKEYFKGRNQFSIADIQSFYQKFEREIKRSTLDWRIYELKNLGVIQKVGRGIYSLEKGQIYIPSVDAALKRLFNKVQNKFPSAITTFFSSIVIL